MDLLVEPGERVLLLGPSGAGKSTLLAALAGLHDPETAGETEGELLVDGLPARQARARTGLVLQDPSTQVVMSRAGDDVAFGLENRAVPRELLWPRVDAALAAVGFGHGRGRSTADLSGGEQQRLALAGVLALRPGLLLLDEPTSQLDPAGAVLVRDAIARVLAASGATALLVEHRVAESLPLVDRVVVLEPAGGVIADGDPDAVLSEHGPALAARGVWVPGGLRPCRRAPRSPAEQVLSGEGLQHPRVPRALPDLTLHAGEAVAVTGGNGTGKSTLAMLLAGLLPRGGRAHAAPAPVAPPRARRAGRHGLPAARALLLDRDGRRRARPRPAARRSRCPAGPRHHRRTAVPVAPGRPGRRQPVHAVRR